MTDALFAAALGAGLVVGLAVDYWQQSRRVKPPHEREESHAARFRRMWGHWRG